MTSIDSATSVSGVFRRTTSGRPSVAFALLGLLLSAGCNKPQVQSGPTRNAKNSLKQISVLFGRYTARHRGQGPKDEAEFRKFIAEIGTDTLKTAAVASVDELLVSPRDNQPFQIRYGIKVGPPTKAGGPIVAYEKTGVDGSRFAVDTLGKVTEVGQSELDKLLKE